MRLGDLLVANGLVSPAQLDLALAEQRRTGRLLGHILVDQGLVTEEDIGRSIAAQFALDFVDLDPATIDPTAVMAVPEAVMRKHEALPVAWAPDGALLVAMANPTDVYALDDIRNAVSRPVRAVVVTPSALLDAVRRARRFDVVTPPTGPSATTAAGGGATATAVATRLRLDDAGGTGAEDAPIVRLVNRLVAQAVAERASDIHLEPTEHDLRIRFRIDGVLHEVMRQPKAAQPGILSRVKVMAEIDIAERRLPQDGRVSLEVDSRAVDLRVATLPTVHGEKIVIRILDTGRALVGLDDLGFLPDTLAHLRAACANPWGAVLVTGPTGSGKSTTLYAALSELNGDDRNIITVEDPVEYRLPGANQVQVNEGAGLTFATALRSILRCDPDTVLIGEIRDRETATIAVEAALTGHLVLSTLHTNDAPGTPSRLLEMGVEPFLVTSALELRGGPAPGPPAVRPVQAAVRAVDRRAHPGGLAERLERQRDPRRRRRPAGLPPGRRLRHVRADGLPRPLRHPRADDLQRGHRPAGARPPDVGRDPPRRRGGRDAHAARRRPAQGRQRVHHRRGAAAGGRVMDILSEPKASGARAALGAGNAACAATTLDDLLGRVVALGGSDLHLSVGRPPTARVLGELQPLAGHEPLTPETTAALVSIALGEEQWHRFVERNELDCSYSSAGLGRFRVAAFVQRGSVGAVLRVIPVVVPPLETLDLPPIVESLTRTPRGLILVTGPTGSGKSTTLAAIVDRINTERSQHIVTVEDPIEFLHEHKRSVVNQREVGADTPSFASALRHVLRQDPDVILVGELRDLETIQMALTAAETGHLVLASLHTQDAPGAVDRIIDVFPSGHQAQIRVQLQATLRAVLAQQLAAPARRPRARRRLRGARRHGGRPQPHPRGQAAPDPVAHAGRGPGRACRPWTRRWRPSCATAASTPPWRPIAATTATCSRCWRARRRRRPRSRPPPPARSRPRPGRGGFERDW